MIEDFNNLSPDEVKKFEDFINSKPDIPEETRVIIARKKFQPTFIRMEKTMKPV
jgi:hypothetical protein